MLISDRMKYVYFLANCHQFVCCPCNLTLKLYYAFEGEDWTTLQYNVDYDRHVWFFQIICTVRKHILFGGPKRLPFTVPPLVFSALKVCVCQILNLHLNLYSLFTHAQIDMTNITMLFMHTSILISMCVSKLLNM